MKAMDKLQRCALLALLILAGCSGNLRDVVGEPPQADVDGMTREGDRIMVDLALRNVNDEALELAVVDLELRLDETPPATGRKETPLRISARGREVLELALEAGPAARARLDALEAGEAPGLRWQMNLVLVAAGGKRLETETRGWLHPVPGQPGRFR